MDFETNNEEEHKNESNGKNKLKKHFTENLQDIENLLYQQDGAC